MTHAHGRSSGLRSTKIQRTRAAMIDAAVDLCLSRGYDNTTIEHISAAADVSSRTFSRYFKSKDAVFVAVLDDLAEEVAGELLALTTELGPLESMRAALSAVLTRAHTARFHSGLADRLTRIIGVVNASPTLRRAAIEYRGPRVLEAMARRMNVLVDDPRLALAMTLISVTVIHAWTELAETNAPLQPPLIAQRIDQTFADLACFAADLEPTESPRP